MRGLSAIALGVCLVGLAGCTKRPPPDVFAQCQAQARSIKTPDKAIDATMARGVLRDCLEKKGYLLKVQENRCIVATPGMEPADCFYENTMFGRFFGPV